MFDLVSRFAGEGFTGEEIQEMFSAAMAHLGGPGERPYASLADASLVVPFRWLGASTSRRIWSVRLAGDAAVLGEGSHVSIDREESLWEPDGTGSWSAAGVAGGTHQARTRRAMSAT